MQRVPDCNKNETEGGDHKAVLRQKKLKAKTLKLGSSSKGMNSSKAEGGGSEGVYDDKVLCSRTTSSMNSLISGKRMRAHGKVAQQCDAIDPPVPRRLRSAINKPVRHVKKRRHLSAISAQISFKDQQTRLDETSLLTEEEEVADALLSLSQISSTCELMPDKVVADDSTKINVSSTSCPEGAAKEGDKTVVPSASCIVGRTDSAQHAKSVPGATNHPSDISPPLLEKDRINDLSLGVVAKLPSPRRESSHNGAQKQPKVQLDVSENYPAQKPEAPLCVVNSNRSDSLMRANGKGKNNGAQGTMHGVLQTPPPCTTPGPDGHSIRPSSSKPAFQANTVSEFSRVTAAGNLDKLPQANDNIGVPTKAWKRSMTHVYVSRVIETHLSRETAASQRHVKAEERPHMRTSMPPNGGSTTLHRRSSRAQGDEEARYAVRLDVRLPAQPSTGMGRQKMVRAWHLNPSGTGVFQVGGSFLNLPASTAVPGAQHVQYLHHPQMAPPQAPHLPQSRAALHHHQMWQLHVAQYQPRAADAAPAGGAWRNLPSLRPVPVLRAPYQGGSRQPLRLM